MLAWSPLLIQKIEIHALGFVLRKLQLNRHRDAEVAPHGHDFAQLILYLTGEGVQTVATRRRRARAGDLFVIPAGVAHGFSTVGHSRPLCLVLDYEHEGHGRVRVAHRTLSPATLNELHALLSRVPRKGRLTLADYPAILAVVARLLGHSPAVPTPAPTLFEKLRDRNISINPCECTASVSVGPGLMEMTRILRAPSSLEKVRVNASMADLVAL